MKVTKKVIFFFRKKDPDAHSIEEVFNTVSNIFTQKKTLRVEHLYAPEHSKSIINIIQNIIFAYNNQGEVNHVTGDIHYILLGLRKKNINILTIHDCRLLNIFPRTSIKFWIYKWFWLDIPLKRATKVTTVSQKTKLEIIKFTNCPPEKIVVIPNPANPIFKNEPREFNSDNPKILQVGTGSNKNLERVIQSLIGIPCKLVIIGQLFQNQLFLLEKNKINYENYFNISIEEVSRFYHECDFVVFASTFEGFGMPIIEANLSGTPIITSDISPINEIAGKAALFVDPYSITDIRSKILTMIYDKGLRERLIYYGFQNASKFSPSEISEKYFNLYTHEK
ncbi:MAG: glycosyltransferase family 4 protein [Bacteroidetes bacterium]|nr:glycosyltransferase family 4 protein [Bacteroidota bacterium]